MRVFKSDVMIIGSGIAGLSSGITLAEKGISVTLVTREKDPKISNTYYAQGGIIYPEKKDLTLAEDIQKASSFTSGQQSIDTLLKYGQLSVDELLIKKAKTDFSRDGQGNFNFTQEAAHSIARILYKGDFTGKEIEVSLINYLKDKKRFPNVNILAGHTAIDLLTPDHHGVSLNQRYESPKILGAYLFDQTQREVVKAMAKKTILATGGLGALYLHHSNSEGARGDGHAMARRAGANIINMEFIQFHPTTFFDRSGHRRFLISEALRGEGGRLINSDGVTFMHKFHRDLEMAPRDIVARAIVEECIESRQDCVYLDISHKKASWIKDRFPTIFEHCLSKKVDITQSPIPVVPAAHYSCGGVTVDGKGQTSLEHLYAVGEVSCTGLHGANRLASTSLLEGLVWGRLAALDILACIDKATIYDDLKIKDWQAVKSEVDMALINQDMNTLKQTMWNYVGLNRFSDRLKRAELIFRGLFEQIHQFYHRSTLNDSLIGLRNAIEVGLIVIKAGQQNRESTGGLKY